MESGVTNTIRHWWLFLLRGIGFILVGVYLFKAPLSGYVALSFIFGLIIIAAGIIEVIHAYANRYIAGQVYRFYIGLIDLALGIILVANIAVSMAILPIVLGIWFLFRGISLLSFSGLVRRPLWLFISGAITLLFALLIIFNPAFGAMTIVLWTAFAFVITGIFNIILAFRLKAVNDVLVS
jgi:uncharacterized membrane protein HdeD (DUF308 family)